VALERSYVQDDLIASIIREKGIRELGETLTISGN
jgi:hypothetical protein